MKTKMKIMIIIWILSVMLPVGSLGLGLYLDRDHRPEGEEWITVIGMMALLFIGPWCFYFFGKWITGKNLPEDKKTSRVQINLRKAMIITVTVSAICGLLAWLFYAIIGSGWSAAMH